ncbi:MAG: RNA methyltransferase [Planctomycetota bacterium]|nr:RNA methyltransferase [Planctomycetota bacterium]
MGLIPIESLEDPRIAVYRDLQAGADWRRCQRFIVEGQHLVNRLLASPFEVDSVLVEEGRAARQCHGVAPHVDCYVAPKELINKVVGFRFHRGVLACGKRAQSVSLEDLELSVEGPLRLVICVQICDPENVGSVIRTAAAFGAQAIVFTEGCADPFSRRVTRVAMGANLLLPLVEMTDCGKVLQQLAEQYQVQRYAAVVDHSGVPLPEVRPGDRWAVVFGNEGDGIPAKICQSCDQCVTIAMADGVDSLNVGVSAGIFLYQMSRHERLT